MPPPSGIEIGLSIHVHLTRKKKVAKWTSCMVSVVKSVPTSKAESMQHLSSWRNGGWRPRETTYWHTNVSQIVSSSKSSRPALEVFAFHQAGTPVWLPWCQLMYIKLSDVMDTDECADKFTIHFLISDIQVLDSPQVDESAEVKFV